jgi:hypothetical protein
MKKQRTIIYVIIFIVLTVLLVSSYSYAIYTGNGHISGIISSADWNVTLNQTGVNNYLSVVANGGTATYDLKIVSNSSVDVIYSIVISNIPEGVSVKLDNAANFTEQSASHEIIFPSAGSINYTGSAVTKTHTLTFKADIGTQTVTDQQISVDVIARQNI